jgi:hypothetical protein
LFSTRIAADPSMTGIMMSMITAFITFLFSEKTEIPSAPSLAVMAL